MFRKLFNFKKIQDKNKELEQEQVRFRKLFKNDKKD